MDKCKRLRNCNLLIYQICVVFTQEGNVGSDNRSVNEDNLLDNPSFVGGSISNRSPSCGKRRTSAFIENGCIYECDGNILGSGTCATERSGTCGSCFGRDWQGGSCR